jgi:hypothetical protein
MTICLHLELKEEYQSLPSDHKLKYTLIKVRSSMVASPSITRNKSFT